VASLGGGTSYSVPITTASLSGLGPARIGMHPAFPESLILDQVCNTCMSTSIQPNVVGHMTVKRKVAGSIAELVASSFAVLGFVGTWGGILGRN
jgi:hypothetical protein